MHLNALNQFAVGDHTKDVWKSRGWRADNWSLHLDKFSISKNPWDTHKHEVLESVTETFQIQRQSWQPFSWLDTLKTRTPPDRWRELRLVNSTRLVVALGRAHALENVGLACLPVGGCPWVPGPAVKGLASTWAYWCGNVTNVGAASADGILAEPAFQFPLQIRRARLHEPIRPLALEILGSDDSSKPTSGHVMFIGGFPLNPADLKLEVDVLTPHTRGDPVPSFFLEIAPGSVWRFPLVALPRSAPNRAPVLLDTAMEWLREALEQVGLGAKTAAGYGRFAHATDAQPTNPGTASPVATAPAPPAATYDRFVVRMKSRWAALADKPNELAKLKDPRGNLTSDGEFVRRFFTDEAGLAERNKWGKPESLNRRARESNLRNSGLLEDEP